MAFFHPQINSWVYPLLVPGTSLPLVHDYLSEYVRIHVVVVVLSVSASHYIWCSMNAAISYLAYINILYWPCTAIGCYTVGCCMVASVETYMQLASFVIQFTHPPTSPAIADLHAYVCMYGVSTKRFREFLDSLLIRTASQYIVLCLRYISHSLVPTLYNVLCTLYSCYW